MPNLFDSYDEFKVLFESASNEEAQRQVIQQIHRLLRPFMLRRLKADVEKTLPTKKEIYVFTGMTSVQK
jgi:SNF2 family DNA or RNA helicase